MTSREATGTASTAADKLRKSDLWPDIRRSGIIMVLTDASGVEIVVKAQADVDRMKERFDQRIDQLGLGWPIKFITEAQSCF